MTEPYADLIAIEVAEAQNAPKNYIYVPPQLGEEEPPTKGSREQFYLYRRFIISTSQIQETVSVFFVLFSIFMAIHWEARPLLAMVIASSPITSRVSLALNVLCLLAGSVDFVVQSLLLVALHFDLLSSAGLCTAAGSAPPHPPTTAHK